MALFRKLFYRKPPDQLVEISERVYVFDSCFKTDALEEDEYRNYMVGIVVQLQDFYPDASFMVFNFRKGDRRSQVSELLSEYDMTVMDYPSQYENCPLLPLEMIHHFLRSSECWLSLDGQQNVMLLHCERGGWPVLAFMLAGLLLYRKMYNGEQRTLEMIYKQAPRELLPLLSPLNPQPSHLRYLQYITRRGSGSDWPPMDKPFNLEFLLLRMVPNFDGKGGCRPAVRVYGQDPSTPYNRGSKLLFSTPKTEEHIRHYRQEESTVLKLNVCCHVQGDVVIECIHLDKDLKHEKMMFRFMFNTAFVQFNSFSLSRDEIDVKWNARDRFQKAFRVEIVTEPLRVNGNGHLGDHRIEDLSVVDDIDPNNAGKVLADRLTSGSCEYKASVTDLSFSDPPSPSARVFHCEPSNPRESIAEAANCLDETDKTSSPIRQHSSPVDLEDGLIQFEKDIECAYSVVTSNILKLVSAPQVRKEGKNLQQSFGGDEPFSTLGLEENLGVTISDYQESAIGEAGELIIDSSVGEIDLSNMQEMDTEDLVELKELGSGGFGTVYHGKWRGVDVAIKRIKKNSVVDQQSGQYRRILESLREAGILSKLQHPNIVSLYGFVLTESSSTLAIVTELVGGGSLRNILHREDIYLDRCKRLTIAKGAASGMEYLHLKNIVHFDLKCDNLLVDLKDPSRPICKVTDFGLSKIKKNTLITGGFRGTLPWMAPELLKRGNNKVSEKIDVYSFGIVMWEILTGEVPYDDMLEGEILGGIYDNTLRPPVPASCDPVWRELMEQCWDGDPQRRPSFAQIASRLHRMLVVSQAEASE